MVLCEGNKSLGILPADAWLSYLQCNMETLGTLRNVPEQGIIILECCMQLEIRISGTVPHTLINNIPYAGTLTGSSVDLPGSSMDYNHYHRTKDSH